MKSPDEVMSYADYEARRVEEILERIEHVIDIRMPKVFTTPEESFKVYMFDMFVFLEENSKELLDIVLKKYIEAGWSTNIIMDAAGRRFVEFKKQKGLSQ